MKSLILGSSAAASLTLSLVAGSAVTQKSPPAPAAPASPSPSGASFEKTILPFLSSHCYACHSGESAQARLALDTFKDEDAVAKHPEAWEKILKNVRSRSMPPPGTPNRPKAEERKVFADWIDGRLSRVAASTCVENPNPGRVTVRRLNRLEYKNTVRDLIGVDFKAAADFPSDDVGYGFDNIGDVLSLPPMLMEKYVAAAETIVKDGYANVVKALPKDPAARDAYTRKTLNTFARRAFRRPVTPAETDRLMKLVGMAAGHKLGYDEGVKLALESVLVSPNFLFRIERDRAMGVAKSYKLGNFELASRLSYFLWSSMPDARLTALAGSGKLRDPQTLESEVRRMLKDPKSKGLGENFGSQWLQTRRLLSFKPDPVVFPAFNEKLRQSMLTETNMFFSSVVREDRSILDFLEADYTFVDDRLAKLYGLKGVTGSNFRKVSLEGTPRRGVLTQASVLTLTSNPTRTSPVKRGKWVLEQILNEAPPPPPPGTPVLNEAKAVVTSAPFRVRLAQHRADPKCSPCHAKMDPIGFSLENFNGIGQWRTKDGKFPVDSSDQLPDGRKLKGAAGLSAVLTQDKDQFARTLSEKMLTFALGRGMERYDDCAVSDITATLKRNDYKFSSLVIAIVKSGPFQMRGVEAKPTPPGGSST